MAGTAVISTIKHDVSAVAPTFKDGAGTEIGRLGRVWLHYNGVSPTILGSFNISSVTKNGTGDYTGNFSTALSTSYYGCAGMKNNTVNNIGAHLKLYTAGTASLQVNSFENNAQTDCTPLAFNIIN